MRLVKGDGGLVTSELIASRLEELLNDSAIASRASKLQVESRSIGKDGTSFKNIANLVESMKA